MAETPGGSGRIAPSTRPARDTPSAFTFAVVDGLVMHSRASEIRIKKNEMVQAGLAGAKVMSFECSLS